MGDFKYSLIAAIGKTNNVIGSNNDIPWKAPMDMKYFKKVTTGNIVIMGRKTFESIGKALPNRFNIVITSDKTRLPDDYHGMIVNNLDAALKIASSFKDKETFVIGGGQIYSEAIHSATKLYLTWVSRKDGKEIEGDAFFPNLNLNNFRLVDDYLYEGDEEYNLHFTTSIRK